MVLLELKLLLIFIMLASGFLSFLGGLFSISTKFICLFFFFFFFFLFFFFWDYFSLFSPSPFIFNFSLFNIFSLSSMFMVFLLIYLLKLEYPLNINNTVSTDSIKIIDNKV